MKHTSTIRFILTGTLVSTSLMLCSCGGDSGPREGTPAFYWAGAKENFAARDYVKTSENLARITATENEYTARARTWQLALTSGIARGYQDLADSFEAGARANKSNPAAFRRSTHIYRVEASRYALEFVEAYDKFQKSKDDPVPLAFPFPTGSAAPVVELTKASAGMVLSQAEVEPAEKRVLSRGVLLGACNAVGAPDDPPKAQELLKSGTLQLPRAAFETAMANALFETGQLYNTRKIDDPDKYKIFCDRALDALKSVPETKATKDLAKKITASLKKTDRS